MNLNNTKMRNGSLHSLPPEELVKELIANAVTSRSELVRQFMDPRRDIGDECGYPSNLSAVPVDTYQRLYERDAIAARVVQVFAREAWQVQPTVYEEEDAEKITEFEEAWDALGSQLRGELSWFGDELGSPIWEYLRRADELSGIGQYGVLLLGIDDGVDLSIPATMRGRGSNGKRDEKRGSNGKAVSSPERKSRGSPTKLLYLRAFPEHLAQITRFDENASSPRYGQPIEYLLTFNDPRNQGSGGIGLTTATRNVHWTRVIHLADNLDGSEIFGKPRMQQVINRLLDLFKLYGGSAEMYWRGAFPGYVLETHPQLGGDVTIDQNATRDFMENYMNGLQRYVALMGMSMKALSPQVVDPTPQIKVQIEAICIQLGIPNRVFMGSERGELASSQDSDSWTNRVRERRRNYMTPRIIIPFVDRLIALGVLPEPETYHIEWSDFTVQTEAEKATVAGSITSALSSYVQSGMMQVVQPMDYLTRILKLSEEDAESILTASTKAAEGEMEDDVQTGSPLLSLAGGITGMIELFQKFKDGAISEESLKQLIMLFYKVSEEKAEEIIADGLPEPPEPPAPPAFPEDPNSPGGGPGGSGNNTPPFLSGDTVEGEEFEEEVVENTRWTPLINHLPGKHEQSAHGRRGSRKESSAKTETPTKSSPTQSVLDQKTLASKEGRHIKDPKAARKQVEERTKESPKIPEQLVGDRVAPAKQNREMVSGSRGDVDRMVSPVTQGKLNECFENSRKEYLARKKRGEDPVYVVGKLTASIAGAPTGAAPIEIDHAWVEVGGKIIDPSPYRKDSGNIAQWLQSKDRLMESAQEHWSKATYTPIEYVKGGALRKPLDDFPTGTPAKEVSIPLEKRTRTLNIWTPFNNAFCPTGKGGGQDNSCGKSKGEFGSKTVKVRVAEKAAELERIIREARVAVLSRTDTAYSESLPPITAAGRITENKLSSAVNQSKLSESEKREYRGGMRKIAARMPDAAHERFAANVSKIGIHPDKASLGRARFDEHLSRAKQEAANRSWFRRVLEKVTGMTGFEEESWAKAAEHEALTNRAVGSYYPELKRLDLDGGAGFTVGMGRSEKFTASHVHAHEIGHAIDGPIKELSSSVGWRRAFEAEIAPIGGAAPLTHYARTKPSEGFAEFARVLYGGGFTAHEIISRFPQASTYWKEKGLWPRHL